MEITLNNQPAQLDWVQTLVILVPSVLAVVLYFIFSQRWYQKIQPHIEQKFGVKMIFKYKAIQIVGPVGFFKKLWIEFYYIFLSFLAFFGPWIVLAILMWFVGDGLGWQKG